MEAEAALGDAGQADLEEKVDVPVKPKLKESLSSSSTAKKPVRSKTKPLYFWTSADVNKWLKKHGGHCHDLYGDLLLEQEVTGRTLIRLNEIKLEKIGITNQHHRKELMQYVLKLRLKHEAIDLKNLDQKGRISNGDDSHVLPNDVLLRNYDTGSGFELPAETRKQSLKANKKLEEDKR